MCDYLGVYRAVWRAAATVAAVALLVASTPGASAQSSSNDDIPRWSPGTPVALIPGEAVFLPVEAPESGRAGDRGLALEFIGVGRVPAALIRLTATARPSEALGGWLGTRRAWTVAGGGDLGPVTGARTDAGSGPVLDAIAGRWVIRASIPVGGFGADLRLRRGDLAGDVMRPNWVDPIVPGADPADPAVRARAFAPVVPTVALGEAGFAETLSELGEDPTTAWRAELAMTGLNPFQRGRGRGAEPSPALLTPIDPGGRVDGAEILREWRSLEVARWRVALLRLWSIDPRLAERVRLVLGRVVSPRPGVWVPMWVPDGAAASLRADLLARGLTDTERAELVSRWLADRPSAAAWVVDDAVQVQARAPLRRPGDARPDDPEARLVSRVAVVDLTGNGTIAWVERPDGDTGLGAGAREIYAIPAQDTVDLSLTAPVPERFGRLDEVWAGLRLRFADGAATLPVQGRAVALRPPGYPISGFGPDLRLDSVSTDVGGAGAGRVAGARGPARIAGSIERVAVEPASRATPARHAWVLELRLGTATGVGAVESASVWFGRRGRSVARVTIGRDARVDWETAASGPEPLTRVITGASGEVESVLIEIEPTLLGRDGMLRLGIQATGAEGTRWSWPRPSVPWEAEPSRLGFELERWFAPDE